MTGSFRLTSTCFSVLQRMDMDMFLRSALISAFAFFQSAMMVAAGVSAPPTPPPAPAASGDSNSDALIILVVLLGAVILAANGMKNGMAPVAACDDEDKNEACDDNQATN